MKCIKANTANTKSKTKWNAKNLFKVALLFIYNNYIKSKNNIKFDKLFIINTLNNVKSYKCLIYIINKIINKEIYNKKIFYEFL